MKAILGLTTPADAQIRPSLEEFRELAREYTVIPVWCDHLADQLTPVAVFDRLCSRDRPGFLLESAEHGERWSRWSFVGRQPASLIRSEGGEVSVMGDPLGVELDPAGGVLAAVETLLAHHRTPELPGLPPLHSGLVGYLGYDVVREVEHLPDMPEDDQWYPDAMLQVVGDLAAIDHFRQRLVLVANAFVRRGEEPLAPHQVDDLYHRAVRRLRQMSVLVAESRDEPMLELPDPEDEPPEVTSTLGGGDYRRAVEAAREHILAGDIFQVVLSQRFDLELDAEPFDVYRVLRQLNPSPYMFFLRSNRVSLVGSSPEPLVKLVDGQVISRPIAGTRRRGATEAEDRRLGAELVEDPKEQAEHLMLLDLARNDVGRVVTFGTEQVDESFTLERYSHVMHLTSQVSGTLAPGCSPVDVLRATMPAGTVSGAPKVRAMEIIDDLEPVKRGPYAGVVGYLDFSGNLDTAIAIRTMVVNGRGRASVQAGAGIVADSVPEQEDQECHNKARALLAAVPAARRMSARRQEYDRLHRLGSSKYAAIAFRESMACAAIEREAILVTGADAGTFLQGQLTQDVLAIPPGGSAWSFLLESDGKVLALLRVSLLSNGTYGLDTDAGQGPAVVDRLRRFLIRVDCHVGDPLPTPMVAVRGPLCERSASVATAVQMSSEGLGATEWVSWPGSPGADLLGSTDVMAREVPRANATAFEALRIEAGWPVVGVDLLPGDIPADAGPHVLEAAVSFTKGCYTGQELVERMDARGASSPRPLRGLVLNEGPTAPPAGAELVVGGEVVGEVTSSAYAAWRNAPVALARVQRGVGVPTVGVLRWGDKKKTGARVVSLPMPAVPTFDRLPST